jgi:hypothetical protein
MAQQPNVSRTKTESTTAGEQHVIPGAKKVSDAVLAKRKAESHGFKALTKRMPSPALGLRYTDCDP